MSERLAHLLAERLGPDHVAAHHGSLSKDRRHRVETRLRAGDLRALVATASLELGIDIGPVELVCQVGSPRAIATLLQRVGRSNHTRLGTPEGILFPLTRDELVECAALLAAVRGGRLDATHPPVAPLDILAQQIVAEVAAAEEWGEGDLLALVRRAAPYAELADADYEAVLELASEGITTGRGKRMAYLHRDRVNAVLRPRRGARLAALTSGGAIAEVGDYRVILDPDDTPVGTVNEDFAIESMVGDVFLLGTHSWRIRRVTQGEVRVTDAEGAQPTIPFWVGEAPSRTEELSEEVSRPAPIGRPVPHHRHRPTPPRRPASADDGPAAARPRHRWRRPAGSGRPTPGSWSTTWRPGSANWGCSPPATTSSSNASSTRPAGCRWSSTRPSAVGSTRPSGWRCARSSAPPSTSSSRRRPTTTPSCCRSDPSTASLSTSAPRLLRSETAPAALEQAVLASPMFTSRWRWNLNRSLAVLRFRGGKKNPLPIQRMESDDLMAAVFPALAACQENAAAGPVRIPDHVLVRQTLHDCLHEAMDVDGLVGMLHRLGDRCHRGALRRVDRTVGDVPRDPEREALHLPRRRAPRGAPDPGRPDAPWAAPAGGRRWPPSTPTPSTGSGPRRRPTSADPEELHDLLLSLLVLRPVADHRAWFEALAGDRVGPSPWSSPGTVTTDPPSGRPWNAGPSVEALFPGATFLPDHRLPAPPAGDGETGPGTAVDPTWPPPTPCAVTST